MKRLFERELKQWKEDGCQKPLLVTGSRQVGKTYLISAFCEKNFSTFLYLNLEKEKDIADVFRSSLDPEYIMLQLQILKGVRCDWNTTVIFLDEIQVCEEAITSLKYFCEATQPYHIVCAGSLLGVKLNRFSHSFPVGKVEIRQMYPMNFEEFLLANDMEMLIEMLREHALHHRSLPDAMHKKALYLYEIYLITGGMPEVVKDYIAKKDILALNENMKKNMILAYLADMSKYTEYSEALRNEQIYKSIPAQLAKENKKFKYSLVHSSARAKYYQSSHDWLINSGMVIQSTKVNQIQSPLKAFEVENVFKLYLSDCGLLMTLAEIQMQEILGMKKGMFFGALTENYVAQELHSYKERLYYYTFHKYEIDFLLKRNGNIIPIEVKAGTNVRSTSLRQYMEAYQPEYAIRISAKNFGYENGIISLPLYAVFTLFS